MVLVSPKNNKLNISKIRTDKITSTTNIKVLVKFIK